MKIVTSTILILIVTLHSFSQSTVVAYHDSTFETQYGASGAYPSNDYLQMVTRFTPPAYPAQLVGLRAYFRNSDAPAPFRCVVYTDTAASVTGPVAAPVYLSPSPLTNPADGGWMDTAYNSYIDITAANIMITAGDVYAGITQYSQINGFVGMAVDNVNSLPANDDRQWISTQQGIVGSWMQFINWSFFSGHYGLTAYFNIIPSAINNVEVTMNIYPNPAKDEVYIESLSPMVQWFDQSGRRVEVNQVFDGIGFHANVSELPRGIYFCKITDGEKIRMGKILLN